MMKDPSINEVFKDAIFTPRKGTWFDGASVVYIALMGMVGIEYCVPCALFEGTWPDGRKDQDVSSFDEFDVTWPDVSLPDDLDDDSA